MKIPTKLVRLHGFVSGNGDRELPQFYAVHPNFPTEYFDTESEAFDALQKMRDFAATPDIARANDKVVSIKFQLYDPDR